MCFRKQSSIWQHFGGRVAGFLFVFLVGTAAAVAESRLLMSHVGMEAYLQALDCRSNNVAAVEVRSSDPGAFDGERIELQRLIGQVRAVISIECPSIQRITAKGTVSNQLYFAGATDKSWGWRIVGLYAPPQ